MTCLTIVKGIFDSSSDMRGGDFPLGHAQGQGVRGSGKRAGISAGISAGMFAGMFAGILQGFCRDFAGIVSVPTHG